MLTNEKSNRDGKGHDSDTAETRFEKYIRLLQIEEPSEEHVNRKNELKVDGDSHLARSEQFQGNIRNTPTPTISESGDVERAQKVAVGFEVVFDIAECWFSPRSLVTMLNMEEAVIWT